MDLVYVAWLSLGILVLADALARRKRPVAEAQVPPPAPPRWLVPTLIALCSLLALARLPFALSRDSRNVDEVMYAATAAFVRDTGQSLFSWGWNLHGHQLLYVLGSWEQPYALVDGVTCLVVGLTAFLLGLTVARAGGGRLATLLTPPLYAFGILRFEGLGANKELYAALFLAAYVFVRLGLRALPRPRLRQVLAGACLGGAFVMKDQAAFFVFAEPLIEALGWLNSGEDRRARLKAFLEAQALAALGFFIPVALLLGLFLSQGALADYVSFMGGWLGSGGSPLPTFVAETPMEISLDPEPWALTLLLGGLFALWLSAVGLLGLAHGLRLVFQAPRSCKRSLGAGLTVVAIVGLVAVSIGFRWSGHYWILLFPALAPLAALRAEGLTRDLRDPSRRVVGGVLALLVATVLVFEILFLMSPVGQSAARGGGLEGQARVDLERVAQWVHERTPKDAPIFVYGWQPELYFAADRRPATRYVGGVTAGMPEVLEDLRRRPPSLILVPPAPGGLGPLWNPYDPERNTELKAWLDAEGSCESPAPKTYWAIAPGVGAIDRDRGRAAEHAPPRGASPVNGLVVRRFAPELKQDFLALHCETQGLGWCRCVAWWVPTWEGWGERTAEANLAARESLWRQGEWDGYLAYVGGQPVGWCQVGERDRLEKLRNQFELKPRPGTWAISCFAIAREHRRQGVASSMLTAVLDDLRARGVQRIEAFPKRTAGEEPGEFWTGPERMYLAAGFHVEREDPSRPILVLELD